MRIFIKVLRQALEAEYTRSHLHHWIDLIFGVHQRPKNKDYSDSDGAVSKLNCYHPAVYKADLKSTCPVKAKAHLTMVKTYGQIPQQLFTNQHPASYLLNSQNLQSFGKIKNVKFGNFIGTKKSSEKSINSQLFAIASKHVGYPVFSINHSHQKHTSKFLCLK